MFRTQVMNAMFLSSSRRPMRLLPVSQFCFRSGFMNPYKHDPTPIPDAERLQQTAKPVWDRVFDHKKYMHHVGPLKLSTGIAFMDVEPFPRMKLMKLYYLILDEVNKLPEQYAYRVLSRETTRFRMKVVDENESIRDIEEKIACGMIEELIIAAHNEIKLLRIMGAWRPWEDPDFFDSKDNEEDLVDMANFSGSNPFPTHFENYSDMRHDRKPRAKPE